MLVAPVGDVELDLGAVEPVRLVHATLGKPGDAVAATVRADAVPGTRIHVLVPDAAPERDLSDRELPAATLTMPGGLPLTVPPATGTLVDDATGVRYRIVGLLDTPPASVGNARSQPAGGPALVQLVRGSAPARVALRVAPADAAFVSSDIDRSPRTLVRLRAWEQGGAPVARITPLANEPDEGELPAPSAAYFGAAVAGAALVLTAWWLFRGRWRARRPRRDD